jgi:hypothetical protein
MVLEPRDRGQAAAGDVRSFFGRLRSEHNLCYGDERPRPVRRVRIAGEQREVSFAEAVSAQALDFSVADVAELADAPDSKFSTCKCLTWKVLDCNGLPKQDSKEARLRWPLFAPFHIAQYPKKYPKQESPIKTGIL